MLSTLLQTPFWSLYNLLLIILYKEGGASPFQIGLFITLRPAVSLLSVYWGSLVQERPDRIKNNLMWASFLGFAPFLLFPWIHNAWFLILSSGAFMMMHRGVIPAWMELFKRNLPGGSKHGIFALGSMISYIGSGVFPLVLAPLLDLFPRSWIWLFPLVALIGLLGVMIQKQLPPIEVVDTPPSDRTSWITKPWISAWSVWQQHPYFRLYLIGFTLLGGSGVMLLQPAIPIFFVKILAMNYTQMAIALSLCKGIGFSLTAPLWAKKMPVTPFFLFCSVIVLLGALFPLVLLSAYYIYPCVFIAYIIYGMLQAGSELTWNLVAPTFAHKGDSTAFSNASILLVGIKGCILPYISTLMTTILPPSIVLLLGSLVCCIGCSFLFLIHQKKLYYPC